MARCHDPQGGAKITVKYASTDPGTLTQALEKTYDFYPEEIRNRDLQNRENNMLLFWYMELHSMDFCLQCF